MQIIRTIVWVLIALGLVAFSAFNWQRAEVYLWDNLVWETKLPAVVIVAFLLGLVPMWLYHRSVKWSLSRRIRSLEASIKSNALSQRPQPSETATPASKPTQDSLALDDDTPAPPQASTPAPAGDEKPDGEDKPAA